MKSNFIELDYKKLYDISTNIFKWYNFNKNSNMLIVGKNSDGISEFFSNKVSNISTVEKFCEKTINNKYEYVILLNCLSFKNSEEYNMEIIRKAEDSVLDDGIILMVESNLLSLKFLSEVDYNDYNIDGITKFDLENYFNRLNIKNYKFYYPLPSYTNANVIFSDEFLPNQNALDRNIDIKQNVEHRNLNDKKILNLLVENNKDDFKYFCDSFLIEIRKNSYNEVKAIYFNNVRKTKYRLITKILKDKVYKYCDDDSSKEHLNFIFENIRILNKLDINTLDTFDNEKVISKFVDNGITAEDIILENLKDNNWNKVNEFIEKFKNDVLNKLQIVESLENNVFERYNVEIQQNKMKQLHFVKYGLFDLIFKNVFYINSDFFVYDQEWMEYNVPLEFILYRSILHMSGIDNNKKEELYCKLDLKQYVTEFFELENKIQDNLLDKELFGCYLNSVFSYKDYKTYFNEIQNQKETEIAELRKQKETEIVELGKQKEAEIVELRKQKETEIIELRKQKEAEISLLKKNKDIEIMNLKNQNEALEFLNDNLMANEKNLINKTANLQKTIDMINSEKNLYADLLYEKDKCLLEKEKELSDLKAYYESLEVIKLRHTAGRIYKKIKGIKFL